MTSHIRIISIAIFLFSTLIAYGQKPERAYKYCEERKFYNYSINSNHRDTSSAIIRQTSDSTELVMARWKDGSSAVGELYKSEIDGIWFCYDRKNRLREELVFNFGECNKFVYYDKRGRIEFESGFSVSC